MLNTNEQPEHVLVKDIPQRILNIAMTQVSYYSVGLVGVMGENESPVMQLLGSGTLIEKEGRHYILTAAHVIDEKLSPMFRKSTDIGLMAFAHRHNMSFPKEVFSIRKIALDPTSEGPDIGVIELPDVWIGVLKAKKSFWNMDKYSNEFSEKWLDVNKGLWALFGCPDVYTTPDASSSEENINVEFTGMTGFSGVECAGKREGFDYLRFLASYDDESDSPSSFGGVSGGGLWRVPIGRTGKGEYQLGHPVLQGMAFRQSERMGDDRSVLCHGPSSVYAKVYPQI